MDKSFSIIIPVYNSYKYIDRCLDSLLNQSYNKFEVIFIDDCSTDDSFEQLSLRLKEVDFEYRLEKNDINRGPGYSRNNGLKLASKDYVLFLDSDDFLSYDCLYEINEILKNNNYDCLVFDYYKCFDNGTLKKGNTIIGNHKEINEKILMALSSGSVCCKVYRNNLIKAQNITFPDLIRSEDFVFNKITISKCNKVYYLNKNLYYYYQRNDSIMHDNCTLDPNNNINAFNIIKNSVEYSEELEMIFIREYLYYVVQIYILKKYSTRLIKEFIKKSKLLYPEWTKNKYIKYQPLYVKICLLLINFNIIFPLRLIFALKK